MKIWAGLFITLLRTIKIKISLVCFQILLTRFKLDILLSDRILITHFPWGACLSALQLEVMMVRSFSIRLIIHNEVKTDEIQHHWNWTPRFNSVLLNENAVPLTLVTHPSMLIFLKSGIMRTLARQSWSRISPINMTWRWWWRKLNWITEASSTSFTYQSTMPITATLGMHS